MYDHRHSVLRLRSLRAGLQLGALMNLRSCLPTILSVIAVLAPAATAQDNIAARWEALRRAQPAGVDLRITVPKATFYLGEVIPLSLSFTASQPRTFVAGSRLYDRIGRMNYVEEYVADPIAATEDPLRGLPGEGGGWGGLSGGNAILNSEKPFNVERVLNEWVRFRAPGTYRLYVLSRRVREVTGDGHTDRELQTSAESKPVNVVSNILTLEIVAPPAEWVSTQIETAIAVLDAPSGNDSERAAALLRAGLTLRFLNTVESGTALAMRLNSVYSFELHSGILDSSYRAELLPVMEQLLLAPGQGISEQFLSTLAQLAVLVETGGVMPPYPEDESAREAWQAEAKRRAALIAAQRDRFVAMLLRGLPAKEPAARAVTRNTLLRVAEAATSRPPWMHGIVQSLIADFRELPGHMQSSLLDSQWRLVRDHDILPLLNELHENPPQGQPGYPSINELVLRRIYELDPARGRQLILEDLRRIDGPRIGGNVLLMLPDENLPELNEVFVAQIARGGPLPSQLIARYATGEIVKEVEAKYLAFNAMLDHQKLPHCPFPLVFYFLKYDPEFGEQELRKTFATGPCYDMGRAIDSLGAYAMSPALERLAIEHLMSPRVPVKRGAAEVLGKYGSPAAQKPLWEAMEYFRSWWKDREDDLRKPVGQEGIFFERALRIALAQASAWVLGETELRRLLALCSSAECCGDTEQWIRSAQAPKLVELSPFLSEVRITVAQYVVTDDGSLSAKLAQFPPGTSFRIAKTHSEDAERKRPLVEAAIRNAGHSVVP